MAVNESVTFTRRAVRPAARQAAAASRARQTYIWGIFKLSYLIYLILYLSIYLIYLGGRGG